MVIKKTAQWSILLVSLAVVFAGVVWATIRWVPPTNEPQSTEQSISAAPLTGYRVPPFSLPSFPDSKPISLTDYPAKPVLINFWATWCPPCQAESPDLVKAYAQYADKVQFIGIDLTAQDSLPDLTAFIKKYGIKYPIAMDVNGTVAQQYQVLAIPASIFVNRQGIIVERYVGGITPQILEENLQKISQ
jgi:peroxiredoxin